MNENNPLKVLNITIGTDGNKVVSDIVDLPQAAIFSAGPNVSSKFKENTAIFG